MRAPLELAACGWLLLAAVPLLATAFAYDKRFRDTGPDPGSGETSHLALAS